MENAVLIFQMCEMDMHLCNPDEVINARRFFLRVVYHTSWQSAFLYAEQVLSMNFRDQNL